MLYFRSLCNSPQLDYFSPLSLLNKVSPSQKKWKMSLPSGTSFFSKTLSFVLYIIFTYILFILMFFPLFKNVIKQSYTNNRRRHYCSRLHSDEVWWKWQIDEKGTFFSKGVQYSVEKIRKINRVKVVSSIISPLHLREMRPPPTSMEDTPMIVKIVWMWWGGQDVGMWDYGKEGYEEA